MNKIILSVVSLLPIAVAAQTTGTFTINGQLGKLDAPAKVYLQKANRKLDSAVLHNGSFQFKDTLTEPVRAVLYLTRDLPMRPSESLVIYLEKGIIKVSSDKDSLMTATVSGTPANNDLQEFNVMNKAADDLTKQLSAKYATSKPGQQETAAFKKEIEAISKKQSDLTDENRVKFIKTHPNSIIVLSMISDMTYAKDYGFLAPLYDGLSAGVKNTKSGKALADELAVMKRVAIGAMAPVFTMPDTSGNSVSLSSFRGKYVLIDMWASWCGPCRAENPNVRKAYAKYKGQNFTILGVSLDMANAKNKWLDAIHKDELTWTQVSDLKYWDCEAAKLYGVRGIPQNFLIDPDGRIVAKNLRGAALNAKLAELFPKVAVN